MRCVENHGREFKIFGWAFFAFQRAALVFIPLAQIVITRIFGGSRRRRIGYVFSAFVVRPTIHLRIHACHANCHKAYCKKNFFKHFDSPTFRCAATMRLFVARGRENL